MKMHGWFLNDNGMLRPVGYSRGRVSLVFSPKDHNTAEQFTLPFRHAARRQFAEPMLAAVREAFEQSESCRRYRNLQRQIEEARRQAAVAGAKVDQTEAKKRTLVLEKAAGLVGKLATADRELTALRKLHADLTADADSAAAMLPGMRAEAERELGKIIDRERALAHEKAMQERKAAREALAACCQAELARLVVAEVSVSEVNAAATSMHVARILEGSAAEPAAQPTAVAEPEPAAVAG